MNSPDTNSAPWKARSGKYVQDTPFQRPVEETGSFGVADANPGFLSVQATSFLNHNDDDVSKNRKR